MTKEEFCKQHVDKITKDNCLFKVLYRDTRTVDLMDEFEYGDKTYLILDGTFKKSLFQDIALIITHDSGRMTDNFGPTITDLKKCIKKYPDSILIPDRIMHLASKISEVVNAENHPNGTMVPLKEPCSFGAQYSANRTDYGCEWLGGGDWEEKTLYGEVTDYMVVGVMLTRSMWSIEHDYI